MNLTVWAERNGVARVTAFRWFRAGVLPVPAWKVGGLFSSTNLPARLDRSPRRRFTRGSRQQIRRPTWIGK